MNESYLAYLKSPEWREKRKEFIDLANNECQECGCNEHLQVHHLNYDNIGDETEDDVEVLCKECHEAKELEKGTDLYGSDDEYGEY